MIDANERQTFCGLIGRSPPMQDLYRLIERAAATDATVFVSGESGSGKELVATAIHSLSSRRKGPLVRVNVTALSESLFESELFGHAKGAFTGALQERVGRFEAAHGGTILLDEIGDLPLSLQVKLLRVLQERAIERVGDQRRIFTDVRIVSATHTDLQHLVQTGRFRADLYYRLHVIPIRTPSLRERKDDVPAIARAALARLRERYRSGPTDFALDAVQALLAHEWPGNVRELENAVEVAFSCARGELVRAEDLPREVGSKAPIEEAPLRLVPRRQHDNLAILQALDEARGCRATVARRLGISRTTLWRRMRDLGVKAA